MDPLTSVSEQLKSTREFQKGRGKDTIFRITIRNQINLIRIADNKANMIITINTIVISLIMGFVGSGYTIKGAGFLEGQILFLPLTVFLIASLISAVCAIIAARPNLIEEKNGEQIQSLLFFGRIAKMSLTEYKRQSKILLKSKKETYDQLVTEQYYYGVVLKRKYKWLGYAYTLLLIGLVLAVLTYLVNLALI